MKLLPYIGMARPLLAARQKVACGAPRCARTSRKTQGGGMGDYLVWLVVGAFVVLIFCIYSLSSQLERCIRLAVEIITGNQRKILEQLETLNRSSSNFTSPNVVPFERRIGQRRRRHKPSVAFEDDRREKRGRRRGDFGVLEHEQDGVLATAVV
jgi:hypothetical protein